jgi:enamine deaminase RidA (YjgF/YER057c/UK114 family)
MKPEIVNPASLGAPRGYSNGVALRGGAILFVAGQIGWDGNQKIVDGGFAAQFERALANALEVVRAAGGGPENIGRLTIYVTHKQEYLDALGDVGAAYRALMGGHYPAMALVEVTALLEPGAKVEIEATAVLDAAT